ncbi:MAG: hypothetical protein R2697_14510 [Ilumatobacteraceae bacterium]
MPRTAASHLAADVFLRTGAQVVVINDQPDGRNINDRCGATDVEGLRAVVTAERAHVGIALDGDADRLIAVDEQGNVVDGDHVIAICAGDLRDRGLLRDDTVVVTVMTNLGFRLAMEAAGIHVVETPVGDRYVLEALNESGYSLGGEQSGHVIFTDRATTGDGLLTALVLLDIVQRSGKRLSQLAATAMTQLPQVLVNIPVAERRPDIADELADDIAAAQADLGATGGSSSGRAAPNHSAPHGRGAHGGARPFDRRPPRRQGPLARHRRRRRSRSTQLRVHTGRLLELVRSFELVRRRCGRLLVEPGREVEITSAFVQPGRAARGAAPSARRRRVRRVRRRVRCASPTATARFNRTMGWSPKRRSSSYHSTI